MGPSRIAFALLTTVLSLSGCSALDPVRTHTDWKTKKDSIRSILVIPAKISVVQVTAGGITEEIDDWSTKASGYVTSAIIAQLQRHRGLSVRRLSENGLPDEVVANLTETRALFEVVNANIVTHIYGPASDRFPDKMTNFDYSLGDEVGTPAIGEADGLLLALGTDFELPSETTSRKSLPTMVTPSGSDGRVVRWGATYMSIALVDPHTGSLLWFRHIDNREGNNYDLKNSVSAGLIVERILKGFLSDMSHGKKAD